jgi:hypothetical protein
MVAERLVIILLTLIVMTRALGATDIISNCGIAFRSKL